MVRLMKFALVVVVAACGRVSQQQQDAAVIHDAAIDSPNLPPVDASPDAPPLRESRELVTGGTRMIGATYTFDIQVGHGMQQSKAAGPTYRFEANAAVKP